MSRVDNSPRVSEYSAGAPAHTPRVDNSPRVSEISDQFDQFAKTFAEQVNLSRLPPPEPGTFSGDPLKYPGWRGAFQTLIIQKCIPTSERIHYVKRYLGGAAKEVIEGYFLLATDDAYDEAMSLLEQRYGDPFVITNAFRDKFYSWPKIALRNFTDILRQCETAMQVTGNLQILNDSCENQKMIAKLPDWLIKSWSRTVADWKERRGMFPPFSEFRRFSVKESNKAYDPITLLQALRTMQSNERNRRPAKWIKSVSCAKECGTLV